MEPSKGRLHRLRECFPPSTAPYIALGALVVMAALLGAMAWASFGPLNPVYRDGTVSMDPPDRILDRSERTHFTVLRRVCSHRGLQAQVHRLWTEMTDNGQLRPAVVWSMTYYDVKPGCELVTITQRIPENLKPGVYVYDVSLRVCGALGRCDAFHMHPVPVSIRDSTGPDDAYVPPPPDFTDVKMQGSPVP